MKHFASTKTYSLLVICAAVLFALAAWAQQSSNSQQNSPSGENTSSNPTTLRGCVTGAAGTYVLLDRESGASYTLVGDNTQLAREIHHEVEVTGQPAIVAQNNTEQNSTSRNGQAAASGQASQGNSFTVQSLRDISDHCQPPRAQK